jgi:transcriptional regulator with AAA-type ATPase domain
METIMRNKEWTDIPPDVHELLRNAKWHLETFARWLPKETYACEGNRVGMAMNLENVADQIDYLLCEYGLPSRWDPMWLTEPETEAEEIERKLSK